MYEAFQTITLAIVLGVACYLVAKQLRIPAILFYLLAGLIFGPLGLGYLSPESLGDGLLILVEVGVAIILFEGGLSLSLRSFQRCPAAILRVIFFSVPIPAIGGALLSHYILGLSWDMAALFGSIIVITGPTVIAPLLKSVNLTHRLETLFHWESIWGDVAGVLLSALALEFLLLGSGNSGAEMAGYFLLTLLDGVFIGLAGGFLLRRFLLPWSYRLGTRDLPGIVAFAGAIAIFYCSHQIMLSSGPLAAAVAGFYLSAARTSEDRYFNQIKHFKDQLTILLIGTLFVLLSAYTDPLQVQQYWWQILLTVLVVQFVLRPLTIKFCLLGLRPESKERWFLGLIGPKGIVCLAMVSYASFTVAGREHELALLMNTIFALILSTGAFTSIFGKPLARQLEVMSSHAKSGLLLVGVNAFSLALASFANRYVDVAFLETSPDQCSKLQDQRQIKPMCADVLDDTVYEQAIEEGYKRLLSLTGNDALDQLICQQGAVHLGYDNVYTVQSMEQELPIRTEGLFQAHIAFSRNLVLSKVLPQIEECRSSFQVLQPKDIRQENVFPLLEFSRDQGLLICTPDRKPRGQVFCLVLLESERELC